MDVERDKVLPPQDQDVMVISLQIAVIWSAKIVNLGDLNQEERKIIIVERI